MKKMIPVLVLGALCAAGAHSATASDPSVVLTTNRGSITIKVFKSEAPITAGNFLDLVKRGFYKNMSFHRVVPGFVIQTGDPLGTGEGGFIDPATKRERTIRLETKPSLRHDAAGVVAMARSMDPNSASSQFYITLSPQPRLDGNYAVFGRVTKGLDVVKKIRQGDRFISAKLVSAPKASKSARVAKPAKPAKKK